MKSCRIFSLVFAVFILCGPQITFAVSSKTDMEKKLDELSKVIQKQQKEIENLKQLLENQGWQIDKVEETRKEEVKNKVEIATEEKAQEWHEKIPQWIKKTKVSGDLRLRYEGIYNREELQPDGSTKDLPNRDRFRIRARLFFDGTISDEVSTHFMICTNQDRVQEATTTNQSFSDDFNDKGIYLHRAFATYKPNWLKGMEIGGGKFKNTFLHTDIMWDPDVNPEGFYERYQYQGWGNFKPFVHLGQMMVNEVKNQSDDPWLFINQAGFEWKTGPVTWTLAGSYYDWTDLENTKYLHTADYKGGGGNTFVLDADGNLQYAYGFKLWEGISFVKFKLGSISTKLIVDYVANTADDVPSDNDTAYFLGFELGKAKQKGDCSFLYKYARIENDAVIGSMNDQDFYGANRKGHKIKFRYMLLDRLQFATAYFYTDPVNDWDPGSVTFSKNSSRMHEDRLQADFIFKF